MLVNFEDKEDAEIFAENNSRRKKLYVVDDGSGIWVEDKKPVLKRTKILAIYKNRKLVKE